MKDIRNNLGQYIHYTQNIEHQTSNKLEYTLQAYIFFYPTLMEKIRTVV